MPSIYRQPTYNRVRNYWKADNTTQRLNSLARVLQKTDRILTGDRELRVIVEDINGAYSRVPAVTRGKDLVLNRPFCDLSTKTGVVGVIGMNWHELSHYLYTASNKEIGWAANKAAVGGIWWSFNILEDQRIETLFSAKYRPARMYFAQMVLDQILKDKNQWDQVWPLLHGRRYLPLEIRQNFRQRYTNQTHVKRIAEIIDEFRLLDLSERYSMMQDHAFALAKEFHTLINGDTNRDFQEQQKEQAEGCGDSKEDDDHTSREPDQNVSRESSEKAKDDTEKQDKEEQETGEDGSQFWDDIEDDEDDDSEEGDEEDGEEGSDGGEGSEDEGDDDGADEGGDGAGSDDDYDSEETEGERAGGSDGGESDRDSGSDEGDATGEGGEAAPRSSEEVTDAEEEGEKGVGGGGLQDYELKEFINDALDAIMDSEVVSDEVQRVKDAVNDPSNFDVEESSRKIQKHPVPDEAKRQCRLVENEFKKLWAELEPGWHYGADEGRLNVARAMNSDDWDDVFDQWDEGKEQNAGIEVAIAVDVSGSMLHYGSAFNIGGGSRNGSTPLDDAMAAVWTIKRAVETLDGHVTVVSFGEEAKTLISRHDKAKPAEMVYPEETEGDTKPWDAIEICRYVLNTSSMPNKLFVIVTDGGWDSWDSKGISKSKMALDNMPGTKMYMAIGSSNPNLGWVSYFHHNSVISTASDIAPLVRAAINTMLRNAKN